MDWKLERQRREKNQATARKHEKERNSILDEMEREFEEIFGEDRSGGFSQYFEDQQERSGRRYSK